MARNAFRFYGTERNGTETSPFLCLLLYNVMQNMLVIAQQPKFYGQIAGYQRGVVIIGQANDERGSLANKLVTRPSFDHIAITKFVYPVHFCAQMQNLQYRVEPLNYGHCGTTLNYPQQGGVLYTESVHGIDDPFQSAHATSSKAQRAQALLECREALKH